MVFLAPCLVRGAVATAFQRTQLGICRIAGSQFIPMLSIGLDDAICRWNIRRASGKT